MWSSLWKNIGKAFAYIGKGALAAAVWSSQHPQVIALVLSAAKVPANVTQGIEAGVAVAGAVQPPQ
jgi:hypothetical protein